MENNQKTISAFNGFVALFLLFTITGLIAYGLYTQAILVDSPQQGLHPFTLIGMGTLTVILFFMGVAGFFTNEPNQSVTATFFGTYAGDWTREGFFWRNPLLDTTKVSLRLQNFESSTLKVNDKSGNPIEVAAIVAWKVEAPKKAVFDVDDYAEYVVIQSEAALRNIAAKYPYDTSESDEGIISLRGNASEVIDDLRNEVQAKLAVAGVKVEDVRLSHLAYAPEIAQAMLQKQQAQALVDARKKTVKGAIGIVNDALDTFESEDKVEFSDSEKNAFASNMMLVLCGDQTAQPVINT